eukprot:EC798737.1.p2 GENE.EC798737.1~~EC798737.1.p2  ORF type:complete len:84 (-),score=14.37 EC798737.1:389-640(-)
MFDVIVNDLESLAAVNTGYHKLCCFSDLFNPESLVSSLVQWPRDNASSIGLRLASNVENKVVADRLDEPRVVAGWNESKALTT